MKRLSCILSALAAAVLGVGSFAADPILEDVLEEEPKLFEFHISLPQILIILIFLFCAACLVYFYLHPTSGTSGEHSGKRVSLINEKPVIEEIEKTDPDFDPAVFRTYVSNVYTDLRGAICDKNLEEIRAFVSDEVIDQIQKNVDYHISRGQTKHYEKNNIYSVKIAKAVCANGIQTVTARVHVSFIEYVTDDASGKTVSGSNTERVSRYYKLRFSRMDGVFSDVSYNLIKDTCPCCGAPLSVDGGGVCEYCHRDLNEGKYGFVLSSYERWKENKEDENGRK